MKGDQAVMYVWAPSNLSDTVPAHGKVTQTLESPDLNFAVRKAGPRASFSIGHTFAGREQ